MCKHPLKGFPIGITENGKPKYRIVPYGTDHVELCNGKWINVDTSFKSPYVQKCVTTFTEIPCGHCIDCRLQYSRQWADRCMFEAESYDPSECWFVTLTYDNDHIMDIGSDLFPGTLVKTELSAFMKRLRANANYRNISKEIRFYGCGEYGSKTFRPHYHIILFGMPLKECDTLKSWIKTKTGFWTYRSPYLEKVWKSGLVVVSPISWDTCAYVARYVMKKVNGLTTDEYIAAGVEPEFVLMSRKPGIGSRYFDEHYEKIYKTDEVFIKGKDGGRKGKPPKFFDKKLEKINEPLYKEIKEKRKSIAEKARELKVKYSGMSFQDILDIEETILEKKAAMLKRYL